MTPIYVTESFLPPLEEYGRYLSEIFESRQLTNQGRFVRKLEEELKSYLSVEHLCYLTNGTVALQLALNALGIEKGEVITTPFSYVATTSAILWERCTPVFVDIREDGFNLDLEKIEEAITPQTRAIMAVHVFGYPADVEGLEEVARKHGLKVIYDAAHAFGVKYRGKSLLAYGDVSTCSFHATKLFHTVEGGCCVMKDGNVGSALDLARRFGHNKDEHLQLGINGKASELHAAMGLCNLPYMEMLIRDRKRIADRYDRGLSGIVMRPETPADTEYNYAYYPVLFRDEEELLSVFEALNKEDIFPRRYFYPSLNTLSYLPDRRKCPVSENISLRVACLPLYYGLSDENVDRIMQVIKNTIG